MKKRIIVGIFVMTLLLTVSTVTTGMFNVELDDKDASYSVTADYGDAPDPRFPSLSASNGPFHLNIGDSYVGWTATAESDALVTDLDSDDGAPLIFACNSPGFWTGWVYVPITVDQSAPNVNRYLNVLIDCDSSGDWCNQPGEWIVRNYKVYYLPGQTYWYCIGGFSWVTFYSGLHWLRITVSDQKIVANTANGWDGSDTTGGSGFSLGETEDWILSWYYDPYGPVPPHDPNDPIQPAPIPECNKAGVIYQAPSNRHVGHSGNFKVCIKNTGSHPIHITEGPWVTDPSGSPITINVDSLVCNTIEPGEELCAKASWEFKNTPPPSNKATCDFEAVGDPEGVNVIIGNAGDYYSSTSDRTAGGIFEERAENKPPEKPVITGPPSGKPGNTYMYNFSSTDPEEDNVFYYIEWGDGSKEEWAGPFESGDKFTVDHSWDEEGTYSIKAKSKDDWDGSESDWATFEVSMPKFKASNIAMILQKLFHRFPLIMKILN